jgi:AAA domain, putative AbiEii toxin, Type IV TA system
MLLTFSAPYLSLKEFEQVEVADFSLITGLNGSGKTHLLQAIENGSIQVSIDGNAVPPNMIKRFDSTSLNAGDSAAADPTQIIRERSSWWSNYLSIFQNGWHFQVRQACDNDSIKHQHLSGEQFHEQWIYWLRNPEQVTTTCLREALCSWPAANINMQTQFKQFPTLWALLESRKEEEATEPLLKLEFERLASTAPVDVQPFKQRLSEVFALYSKIRDNNILSRHYQTPGSLSDDEFVIQYGIPPWDFLNQMLEAQQYDFRVTVPPIGNSDLPFVALLDHKVNKSQISFDSLSSGERILIALVMCVYSADSNAIRVEYPKVILFDEIDAFLHPSMIATMLQTIREVLINRHNLKVVLTTHSATTMALANDDEVHLMSKVSPRLTRCARNVALRSLSAGVPLLNVSVESRRPVYVESDLDVTRFEALTDAMKSHLVGHFDPVYLSTGFRLGANGTAGEGSDRVREVIKRLRSAGMTNAYGLCDGDNSVGKLPEGILSLGGSARYSIENFLLDPLLVAATIMLQSLDCVNLSEADMGLSKGGIMGGLETMNPQLLQSAADAVLRVVGAPSNQPGVTDPAPHKLVCGETLLLPGWFLREPGHQWYGRLSKSVPALHSLVKENTKNREHALMLAIIRLVVRKVPGLVSGDLLSTLNALRLSDPTSSSIHPDYAK